MLSRHFGSPKPQDSPDNDQPAPVVGRRLRLMSLSWVQVGLLAVLVCAVVVRIPEPTPKNERSPAWAIRTGHAGGDRALAIAPDGRKLAAGGDQGVVLWELDNGGEKELSGASARAVICVAYAPDGATPAAGDCDGAVTLWDVATGSKRATLRAHSDAVLCVAFSPDGRTLATGSADHSIRLWDLASQQVLAILRGHPRPVSALRFGPGGRTLASGCNGGLVKLWDVVDGQARERPEVRTHRGPVRCLAFSPDGSLMASAGVNDSIKLWVVGTGAVLTMPATQHDSIQEVSFSSDGRSLILVKGRGTIQIWDVASGRERVAFRVASDTCCVAFSSDSRFVATGGADATVRAWDLAPSLAQGLGEGSKPHPGAARK
jgi:WD40 repeat protein